MLILLVGPKGSGKSHVGRLLESRLGVRFFHVEPLWLAYHDECARTGRDGRIAEGVRRIHPAIAEALETHRHVSVETTGASAEILDDLLSFRASHPVLLARLRAPLPVCLARIAARDPSHQIAMDEAGIRRVHELSDALDLDFDIVLDTAALGDEEILEAFGRFVRS